MIKRFLSLVFISVICFAVIGVAGYYAYTYLWVPFSDNYVLSHADPAMIKLATEAGMSRKGELVFLRTDPQLVSDADMETDCANNTAANNSNGFIEQGCYNTNTHRIYIRDMPSNLYGLVVATASYEMLHPVYISLDAGSQGPSLDAAIEANYVSHSDMQLKAQVINFAKTEPGARDLELFSLLGTGYTHLSGTLAAYYAPYFDDLHKTIAANATVNQLFNSDQKQLAAIKVQISNYDSLATAAYASSISWARAGNQYLDDYYYQRYQSDIGQENAAIDHYNSVLGNYNKLVTEYNGTQPVQGISPVQ